MSEAIEKQVIELEERLRRAMLDSNVSELDALLADDLIFTNHLGMVMGKRDDVAAHEAGIVKIDELTLSDRSVRVLGDAAVVTVRAHLDGSYDGQAAVADFRFTRVWAKRGEAWRVVVGHSSVAA